MSKNKKMNIVNTLGETGYVINDLGKEKNPRFELYYLPDKKVVKKIQQSIRFL